jgi:hypothetical protein
MDINVVLGRFSWEVTVLGNPIINRLFWEGRPPERVLLRGN